jgi:hypothetical protein
MRARASILLKSRASLARFLACLLPGGDKDFSGFQYYNDDDNAWVVTAVSTALSRIPTW